MQGLYVGRRRRAVTGCGEQIRGVVLQLRLPLDDLVGMHIVLLRELREGAIAT